MRYCQLPINTGHQTLESFDAYTKDLKQAHAAAREVAKPNGELKGLTIIAKVDSGKSHLAVAICREWLKCGVPARYVFVPDLLDELRAGYQEDGEHDFVARMHFYRSVPMLVMDDLGAEKPSEWAIEKLTTIINTRAENGLHLVVTTNKTLSNLPGDTENRIGSRLRRYPAGKVVVIGDAKEYCLRERR